MLICKWHCSKCGWEGSTSELEEDADGHKVCPVCGERGGLE